MTDMMKADEVVLKADTRGRIQTPMARREEILDEFERSGLSGKKFAVLVGIKYPTLATWASKRRRARGIASAVGGSKGLRLVEAVVEENGRDRSPLVLQLPGGARMEIKDAGQATLAAVLLRTLAKSC
jgi:DNA-binding transcriptional regulator YiaG